MRGFLDCFIIVISYNQNGILISKAIVGEEFCLRIGDESLAIQYKCVLIAAGGQLKHQCPCALRAVPSHLVALFMPVVECADYRDGLSFGHVERERNVSYPCWSGWQVLRCHPTQYVKCAKKRRQYKYRTQTGQLKWTESERSRRSGPAHQSIPPGIPPAFDGIHHRRQQVFRWIEVGYFLDLPGDAQEHIALRFGFNRWLVRHSVFHGRPAPICPATS